MRKMKKYLIIHQNAQNVSENQGNFEKLLQIHKNKKNERKSSVLLKA